MKYYYDFHIHSALSPCGDETMTPNNIVNMALLKELDMIAVADHNSCKNVSAIMEVAQEADLLVIPAMEAETAEEIHVLCLLPDIAAAIELDQQVEASLPRVKNREKIFGTQMIMDAEDEVTGYYENLLLTASAFDLDTLVNLVHSLGGAAIPAHVDRSSNSIIASLGFLPPELPVEYIEISRAVADPEVYLASNRKLFPGRQYEFLRNSDAHYLGDINERLNYLKFDEKPTAEDVIARLRAMGKH